MSKQVSHKHDESPQTPNPSKEKIERQVAEGAVASAADNAKLEHSKGGATTRDDRNDLGVPMLPGSPKERQGPEDALGKGEKRGDYSQRIGPSSYHPHAGAEAQRPNVKNIGDDEGKKGGVDNNPPPPEKPSESENS